jgi:hypothetical protein
VTLRYHDRVWICHGRWYRAAEWRHKQIELAAHELLLQYLDMRPTRRRRDQAVLGPWLTSQTRAGRRIPWACRTVALDAARGGRHAIADFDPDADHRR